MNGLRCGQAGFILGGVLIRLTAVEVQVETSDLESIGQVSTGETRKIALQASGPNLTGGIPEAELRHAGVDWVCDDIQPQCFAVCDSDHAEAGIRKCRPNG
jgi:hypothetical protein